MQDATQHCGPAHDASGECCDAGRLWRSALCNGAAEGRVPPHMTTTKQDTPELDYLHSRMHKPDDSTRETDSQRTPHMQV